MVVQGGCNVKFLDIPQNNILDNFAVVHFEILVSRPTSIAAWFEIELFWLITV